MKKFIIVALIAAAFCSTAAAQTAVRGYTKKDGTYVQPHYRSSPNTTTTDNYSTRGNVNPYTGQSGTKPDTRPSSYAPPAASSPYGSPPKAPTCTSLYGC